MNWITKRLGEPSSYAAAGAIVVGIGVLLGNQWVVLAGIVGGVAGFALKEKGKF